MPRSKVIAGDPLKEPCPNCGNTQGQQVLVLSLDARPVLTLCNVCWPKVYDRQLPIVRAILRQWHQQHGHGVSSEVIAETQRIGHGS